MEPYFIILHYIIKKNIFLGTQIPDVCPLIVTNYLVSEHTTSKNKLYILSQLLVFDSVCSTKIVILSRHEYFMCIHNKQKSIKSLKMYTHINKIVLPRPEP